MLFYITLTFVQFNVSLLFKVLKNLNLNDPKLFNGGALRKGICIMTFRKATTDENELTLLESLVSMYLCRVCFAQSFSFILKKNPCPFNVHEDEGFIWQCFILFQWWIRALAGRGSLSRQESFMQNLRESHALHEGGFLRAGYWDLVVRVAAYREVPLCCRLERGIGHQADPKPYCTSPRLPGSP